MAPRRNALPTVDFESTGNRARQAAAGNPGTGGFNDRSATDFAAGLAGLNDMVQRIQLERDSVKAVGLESSITIDAQKEQAALNPLDKDYQTQVKAVWDNAKKRAMEGGISSTPVLDDLSKRMDRHGAAMQIAAIGTTRAAVDKQAQLTYKDAKDAQNAKIRNDPANANLYVEEFRADAERLKVGMDPVNFETLSRTAADDFAKNQVIGYAEKGNFGAARNALKAQAPHLDTGAVSALSGFIDGKESKARADGDRARTANAAGVLLDIEDQFNGKKPIDPNMRDRLDAMKSAGAISPEQHLMAVKTWNNENQRYLVEAKKDAVAMEHAANGTIPNQETADRAFRKQFGDVPFGAIAQSGTPEQKAAGITLAVAMASGSGGYLPLDMKSMISNADNMTNPKQAAAVSYAAEAMDELETKAAGKISGVTLSDTGVVNRTRAEAKRLMQDGVPKAEAYAMAAQTQMPKDKMTLQVENDLKEVAKADLKKMSPAQEALAAVSTFAERNIPFVTTPELGAQMGQVYARVYEEAFVATNGDKTRAKALADKKIADTYGPTKVGVLDAKQEAAGPTFPEFGITPNYVGMEGQGKVAIQAYPPEKYMKRYFPQMSDDQLAKMAMADLDAINRKLGVAPNPSKDAGGAPVVKLVPNAITADDIRKGDPPRYEYRILRGDLYEPIPTANGPLMYRVPSTVDQVKGNPAYMEAEKARLTRDEKARNLDLEVKKPVPDEAADERVKRMREEGRKLKGNR